MKPLSKKSVWRSDCETRFERWLLSSGPVFDTWQLAIIVSFTLQAFYWSQTKSLSPTISVKNAWLIETLGNGTSLHLINISLFWKIFFPFPISLWSSGTFRSDAKHNHQNRQAAMATGVVSWAKSTEDLPQEPVPAYMQIGSRKAVGTLTVKQTSV